MFTGIIEEQGVVANITKGNDVWRLDIQAPRSFTELPLGASVACSGACLTIVEKTQNSFAVEITSETRACTNFRTLAKGAKLNLERAMSAQGRFDGHIVSGHIDGVATIEDITKNGDEMVLKLKLPPAPTGLIKYIAAKGSVALDGVSLTVNRVAGDSFEIMLIPHTLKVLGWHGLEKGYCFNLEIDLLSRYVIGYLERREQ